ncbi:general substrate transporter [Microdochium bolleyi]|uniref:General substrate transporter n=1 Tax=Microdochium bolleyi TaxID=196109 RepID=A0A136ITN4_9PEZI|nr:general substrate transporter [Microdochium bolleyi]
MFNWGYDTLVFSGVVAMKHFNIKFGECHVSATGNPVCAIPGGTVSIMNAAPFVGKLFGIWLASPLAERLGRKPIFLVVVFTSYVGVILQITATTVAQFTVGRVVCYAMTGVCAPVIPAYIAEVAPAEMRGLLVAMMHLQIVLGNIVASLINTGTSKIDSNTSWMIPIGFQFVLPSLMAAGYPLLVESPRWLVSKDQTERALVALRRLRGAAVSEASIAAETELLVTSNSNRVKGTWSEVFTGTNRRRTLICILAMVGQQITGQVFVLQYGVLFYQKQGYTNSFELLAGGLLLSFFVSILTTFVVDHFGRRPLLISGGIGQAVFLLLIGAVSTPLGVTRTVLNLQVAGFYLWAVAFNLSSAPLSYILLSESSPTRLVEKVNLVATTVHVVVGFTVSITAPYLLYEEYANLGGKVGYIYGTAALVAAVLAFFFVPEMKGRSLEEIDVLFANRVPARQFKTTPVDLASLTIGSSGAEGENPSSRGDDSEKRNEVVVESEKQVDRV